MLCLVPILAHCSCNFQKCTGEVSYAIRFTSFMVGTMVLYSPFEAIPLCAYKQPSSITLPSLPISFETHLRYLGTICIYFFRSLGLHTTTTTYLVAFWTISHQLINKVENTLCIYFTEAFVFLCRTRFFNFAFDNSNICPSNNDIAAVYWEKTSFEFIIFSKGHF